VRRGIGKGKGSVLESWKWPNMRMDTIGEDQDDFLNSTEPHGTHIHEVFDSVSRSSHRQPTLMLEILLVLS